MKFNVKNNLEEQLKSLNNNNIPYKYYNPQNNINIHNYLCDKSIIYKCPSSSYLSLNELLKFVDSINNIKDEKINYMDSSIAYVKTQQKERMLIQNERNEEKYNIHENNLNNRILRNEKTTFYQPENYHYNENIQKVNHPNNNDIKNVSNYNNEDKINPQLVYHISSGLEENSSLKKEVTYSPKKNMPSQPPTQHNIILHNLLQCRTNLSKLNNIKDPEKLISTKNIKLLSLHRPNTIEDIKNLNLTGFGEDKIKKYGYEILKVFHSSYQENNN
ncbi:conserved Plasmodium protein, unknown function [Plasmodium sp. gorilla clade G2]|uniref:conserved Plasmodium protein, unknown function n=1 Tax=Plasmodium sp. gorilla clade G2 TaxID=880535 RepID=UPI000D216C80|nr:conserved Plasmodium protein, unknown function [Plasmodium sp. gorilla clade G2]SOV18865.1 conserved Plasmodium protein, unknown function [Plasmodium sp. gorilla clade G2]